ncbi:unnamed protein product [Fusarium fujikuroi]|uniref:Uncharacterized protein n=1 Tax=Fusarium fujikuroi TaxID=5127 RepID=A0A9Q9RBH7_FUSFU|nr:unnamed protein product [Fusarium fujikuroi]
MAYEGIWNGIDYYMWLILTGVRAWDLISRNLHRIYQSEVCTEDGELETATGYTSQRYAQRMENWKPPQDIPVRGMHRGWRTGNRHRIYQSEVCTEDGELETATGYTSQRNPQAAQTISVKMFYQKRISPTHEPNLACEKEGGPSRVQRQRREDEGGWGEGPKSGYPDQRFEAGIPASLLQPNVPRMFEESSLPSDSTAHHRHGQIYNPNSFRPYDSPT